MQYCTLYCSLLLATVYRYPASPRSAPYRRWTITDTSVSPDQRFVIYASIMPVVHLVEVGGCGGRLLLDGVVGLSFLLVGFLG